MEVKTLSVNVLKYGRKKGETIKVTEQQAKHLLKLGVVEEVRKLKRKAKGAGK